MMTTSTDDVNDERDNSAKKITHSQLNSSASSHPSIQSIATVRLQDRGALGARSLSLNPEKSERNAHRATLYTATGPNSKGKGVVNDGNRDHYNHPKTAHSADATHRTAPVWNVRTRVATRFVACLGKSLLLRSGSTRLMGVRRDAGCRFAAGSVAVADVSDGGEAANRSPEMTWCHGCSQRPTTMAMPITTTLDGTLNENPIPKSTDLSDHPVQSTKIVFSNDESVIRQSSQKSDDDHLIRV
ncbi:hypothetical protein RP20_CCG002248 [Aedes albopictus]|nr:hypothetical protein RP20_CCG002248 [Aedes albopictus]